MNDASNASNNKKPKENQSHEKEAENNSMQSNRI